MKKWLKPYYENYIYTLLVLCKHVVNTDDVTTGTTAFTWCIPVYTIHHTIYSNIHHAYTIQCRCANKRV